MLSHRRGEKNAMQGEGCSLFTGICFSAAVLLLHFCLHTGMGELSVCSVTRVGWKGLSLSASSRRAPSLLPSYKNVEVVRAVGVCWWVSEGVLSRQRELAKVPSERG